MKFVTKKNKIGFSSVDEGTVRKFNMQRVEQNGKVC